MLYLHCNKVSCFTRSSMNVDPRPNWIAFWLGQQNEIDIFYNVELTEIKVIYKIFQILGSYLFGVTKSVLWI